MPRRLPLNPSLEQLRKQARDLLAAHRRGDPEASARLRRWFPDLEELRLAHAQLTLAREHGFPSWPRLAGWLSRG